MKKLVCLLALLLAAPAFGAAWTVNTATAQDARFERNRIKLNAATCTALGLVSTCTQAQARNAFCAKPGSSGAAPCTVLGQSSNEIQVYSTIGDYLDRFLIDAHNRDLKVSQEAEDIAAWGAWLAGATLAKKNAVCAAAGLPNGCLP